MKKRIRKILIPLGVLLVAYIGGITAIARIPGNVTGETKFGPQITIWIEHAEDAPKGFYASIITMPDNGFLEALYAPFFSSADFQQDGNPNWVSKWIFGVDISIADRLPKQAEQDVDAQAAADVDSKVK